MKIALIGNVCNNMYNIGMALKKHTDIVPHLYLESKTDLITEPDNNDPEARKQEWVFRNPRYDPTSLFKKLDFSLVKKLKKEKYDAIIVSDAGVWLSPFIKDTTFFFWTTGADLTRMPFPRSFNFFYKGIRAKTKAWYMAILQRWGIKHIDYFMTQPFMPFLHALKKLKVPEEKITNVYFPIIIDLDIFKYAVNYREKIGEENYKKIEQFGFRIFHPSRLMISQNKALFEAGQWKGNELLLKALRIFIDKYKTDDICITLPERDLSPDKEIFDKYVSDLGLEKNIVWVKGKHSEGLTKDEMVGFYSSSDLVVDEFGAGWFGSVVIESAACSKPVMCYVTETVMQQLYSWHPVISVNTPETIAEKIAELYFNKEYAESLGKKSRVWAEEFHSQENAGKKYAREIQQILNKLD